MLTVAGLQDNKLLLRIANYTLTSEEQFQLGVLLDVEPSTIRQLMRDSEGAVTITFAILEAWRNSRKDIGNDNAGYDQLCEAYLELKRAEIADYVRRGECVGHSLL